MLQSNTRPLRELFDQNIKPCLKVVGLMILVVGIAYPRYSSGNRGVCITISVKR